MTKPPAFQFYVKDWLTSKAVIAMTPAQCGYYINLLAHAWDNERPGYLPNSPAILWKLAGADSRKSFERDSKLVLAQFKVMPDGSLANQRLLFERRSQIRRSRENSRSAKARWDKKKQAPASLSAPPSQCSSSSSASSSASASENLKTKARAATTAAPFVLPDWIPTEAWSDFLEMRAKQRKAPTERAKAILVGKLEGLRAAGHDPQAVLEQSTVCSWASVFPLKKIERASSEPRSGPVLVNPMCATCGRTRSYHLRAEKHPEREPQFDGHKFVERKSGAA